MMRWLEADKDEDTNMSAITEILTMLDSDYKYVDEKFYKKDGSRKAIDVTDIENAIIVKAFKIGTTLVADQVKSIIEKFKEVKNRPTLSLGEDEALTVNGNYQRLILNGIKQLPNEVEIEYLQNIYFARDPNNIATYFLKTGNVYTLIGTEKSMEIKAAFERSNTFHSIYSDWESKLLEWGNGIRDAYNNDPKSVTEYAKANIPTALITSFESFVVTVKEKLADKEIVIAKSVIWGKNGQNPTFYDYMEKVIEKYPSMAITELPSFPDIYGNSGDLAMSIFDKTPFEVDTNPVLNEAWLEMKDKYTENEWKVLAAWIWGVLDSKNKGRQALFIIDYPGYSGKGKLIDFISHVLGNNLCAGLVNGSMKNQFGFSKVWDKRLITIGDNKNSMVAKTEWFHNILGGDRIDVEYKGAAAFTAKMNAKLLVCSNNPIEVNPNLLHERTRTIIIKPVVSDELKYKMSAKDSDGKVLYDDQGNAKMLGDNNYLPNLIAGGKDFLIFAYQCYKELCPTSSEIVVPNDVMNNVYDITPTESLSMDYYLDQFVVVTGIKTDKVTDKDFYTAYQGMLDIPCNSSVRNDKNLYQNMKDYILKTESITHGRDKTIVTRPPTYFGLKLKRELPSSVSISGPTKKVSVEGID